MWVLLGKKWGSILLQSLPVCGLLLCGSAGAAKDVGAVCLLRHNAVLVFLILCRLLFNCHRGHCLLYEACAHSWHRHEESFLREHQKNKAYRFQLRTNFASSPDPVSRGRKMHPCLCGVFVSSKKSLIACLLPHVDTSLVATALLLWRQNKY